MQRSRFRSSGWSLFGSMLVALFSGACDESPGGVSNALTPTSPTPPGLAIPFTQNSCTATLTCAVPGPDAPPTPSVARITLGTGTSPSCRAPVYRNAPSPAIPVEFTIRNPAPGFGWRVRATQDASSMLLSPSFGFADATGPITASASFRVDGLNGAANTATFTQNLVLEIFVSSPSSATFASPAVATCSVIVWGETAQGR